MSKVEKALLDATGVKPRREGEDRQKYLVRVMVGVQKLSDDAWEGLASVKGAQEWYNTATDADNKEKSVPDFPDAEEAVAPEDQDEKEVDEEEEVDDDEEAGEELEKEDEVEQTKAAAGKAAKKAKVAGGKKPAAGKSAKTNGGAAPTKKAKASVKPEKKAAKGTSMRRALKRMIVKKPSRTVEDLMAALEKQGYKSPSRLTVATMRADTRDTIKVLNEAGITDIAITDGRSSAA